MKHSKWVVAGSVGVVGLVCIVGAVAEARDHDDDDGERRSRRAPTAAQIEFARGTSDLLLNTTVAALIQEINETTPENAAQGSLSIGLVFNDRNRDIRLVGTLEPLSNNDYPADSFERTALARAMVGQPTTAVERIGGEFYFRRTFPLSNFAPQCAMCHPNFAALSSSDWVGALMLRVPIDTD